jgi:hypothetical protein
MKMLFTTLRLEFLLILAPRLNADLAVEFNSEYFVPTGTGPTNVKFENTAFV